jgi:hypothetical protein
LLAKDLAQFSPDSSFVVLTDRPDEFSYHANVLAFNHRQQSIGCYQDKVYVIREALSLFDSCMFLDADMRILAPFQPGNDWPPGITARSCSSIFKHFATQVQPTPSAQRKLVVVQKAARKLDLDLRNEQIQFVHEFLFVVTKDTGKEATFLTLWEQLGRLFELNGLYSDEGHAIGLAAAKAGLPICHHPLPDLEFFKDKIEQVKIQKGQADASKTRAYFETRKRLACVDRPLFHKTLAKLRKYGQWSDRAIRLRIASLENFDFYYR